jgi:hypothetical protein
MAKRRTGPTLIQQSRRVPAEEKALYHQELGAGRSHVKRKFLGLTDDDVKAIVARLDAAMDKRISQI